MSKYHVNNDHGAFDMIKPLQIEVPTTVSLTVKQPQIIPYDCVKPLRSWFDLDKLKANPRYFRMGHGVKGDFKQLRTWAATLMQGKKREVLELHLPCQDWAEIKKKREVLLSNPKFNAALYCVAGKNFNRITGHPDGTELFVIEDQFYRRLTWRSITTKYWDKKDKDAGIAWKDGDEFVYFLVKLEKINQEPTRSLLIDGMGMELMDRDRPKPKEEKGQVVLPR
jgi:hypothetical protein